VLGVVSFLLNLEPITDTTQIHVVLRTLRTVVTKFLLSKTTQNRCLIQSRKIVYDISALNGFDTSIDYLPSKCELYHRNKAQTCKLTTTRYFSFRRDENFRNAKVSLFHIVSFCSPPPPFLYIIRTAKCRNGVREKSNPLVCSDFPSTEIHRKIIFLGDTNSPKKRSIFFISQPQKDNTV
jgi:hypothetical protein